MSFSAAPSSSLPTGTTVNVTTAPRGSLGSRLLNVFRRKPAAAAAAVAPPASPPGASSPLSSLKLPSRHGEPEPVAAAAAPVPRRSSKWFLFWYYSVYPGGDRKMLFFTIIDSWYWRVLMIVLTVILLFGAQIRDIFVPSAGDLACDIVFLATFVIFMLDILMRIDCLPTYFLCSCRSKDHSGERRWTFNPQLGSFLFWCDLISSLTLLSEISFINKKGFEAISYTIELDPFGVPWNGLDQINQATPIELDVVLLVTICKTARVARFIRSNKALKISSKVNWFWFLNLINPCWYVRGFMRMVLRCCECCAGQHTDDRGERHASSYDDFMPAGARSGEGIARGRSSWAGAGLPAIREVSVPSDNDEVGIRHWPVKALRFIGLAPPNHHHCRRHFAATKIQRAWRRHKGTYNVFLADKDRRGRDNYSMIRARRSVLHRLRRKSTISSSTVTAVTGSKKRRTGQRESQVGTAMRELTGHRVAGIIIISLILTVLFTYTEIDATRPATMIVLHNQTSYNDFVDRSLEAARGSSIPDLFSYELANGEVRNYSIPEVPNSSSKLRPRETLIVTVKDSNGGKTVGYFALKSEIREQGLVALLSTIFILVVWFFGVTAFAGPVMVLVVVPIERMVRLLGMLMVDPLGYENSPRYRKFIQEEDQLTKNTRWTKEILKGMETSFLMSTILRIGSLMKVGFGSAGVEIIRNNLEKGQNKSNLALNSQGSSVSCIFLFCDIRQFTDATECLQEEVFVFTNKIAAVVHSICTAYGGSANKNIGDAFLLSWLLDDAEPDNMFGGEEEETFTAKRNQADKALLSVVKICMALHYDDFYISTMSEQARTALLTKLAKRPGPVVQMGFGLHAGRAVQGAIGSQRKIDATYISNNVEQAEFLESSTKKYGVNMLMSGSFHRLLHPSNRRRCRKVDQLLLLEDDEDFADDYFDDANARLIELYTFDMDIEALRRVPVKKSQRDVGGGESDSEAGSVRGTSRRDIMRLSGGMLKNVRRRSMMMIKEPGSDENLSDHVGPSGTAHGEKGDAEPAGGPAELVLPTGPAIYNANVWVSDDLRRIRERYSDGLFFQKFSSGLQAFYSRDWNFAKECFGNILGRFEDGPSRYFLNQIEEHGGVPPKGFKEYGTG